MRGIDSNYGHTLGIRCLLDSDGSEILLLPFTPALLGRPGFFHGGAIGGLLSLACDDAMERQLRVFGLGFQPLSTSLQFLRGGRERAVHAAAFVQLGAKIASVNAIAWQSERAKPIASACRKYLVD